MRPIQPLAITLTFLLALSLSTAQAASLSTSASVFSALNYCATPGNCKTLSGQDVESGQGSARAGFFLQAPDGILTGGNVSAFASFGSLSAKGGAFGPPGLFPLSTVIIGAASFSDEMVIYGGTGVASLGLNIDNASCLFAYGYCQYNVTSPAEPHPTGYFGPFQYGVPFLIEASMQASDNTYFAEAIVGNNITLGFFLGTDPASPLQVPGATYQTASGVAYNFRGVAFAGAYIPEPGTIALAAAGLLALIAARRRRLTRCL